MDRIKTYFANLIDDLKNKRFTDRVKNFVAALSCAVLVVTFVCFFIAAVNKKEPAISGETPVNEAVSQEQNEGITDENGESTEASASSSETDLTDTVEVVNEDILGETEDAGQEYIDGTLFLGDSNTVRMMNYGITSLDNTLAVVGMGIQSVKTLKCIQFSGYSEPITMIDAIKLMKPSRIIITFGTNNANGMSVEDFIKKYTEALDAIVSIEPDVDILINSIPPICQKNSYPKLSQNSIDKFNNALIDLAKDKGYKYIDSASVMKNESTGYAKDGYTVSDGIHISEDGFAAMFTYIRTHSHEAKNAVKRAETAIPKQVKATYVIDSNGKMNNDPNAYKEMSEVSKAEQEALKKALEEATAKKAQETALKDCKHLNYTKNTISEATESSTGRDEYKCNDCGYVYTETIPKKEHKHSYQKVDHKDATYDEAGYDKYGCSCGDSYKETIPVKPRPATPVTPTQPSEPVTPPTDTSSSETTSGESSGDSGNTSDSSSSSESEQPSEPEHTEEADPPSDSGSDEDTPSESSGQEDGE